MRIRKITAVILSLIFLLTLSFSSCKNNENQGNDGTQNKSDSESEAVSDKTVIKDGKTDYIIYRSGNAAKIEIDAAIMLREKIEQCLGVRMRIINDLDGSDAPAIIVGNTTRESGKKIFETLKYSQYATAFSGDDLVICGGNADKTMEAVKAFTEKYLKGKMDELTLPGDLYYIATPEYSATNVKIQGKDLAEYAIVIPKDANEGEIFEAEFLQATFTEKFGIHPQIIRDGKMATECEITLGNVNRSLIQGETGKNDGFIIASGTTVCIGGDSIPLMRKAARRFIQEYILGANDSESELLINVENERVSPYTDSYKIMSFNLLCDGVSKREDAVLEIIKQENPDVLGVQECTEEWYAFLCSRLGDRYGYVGEINNPKGQNWRNAIFYNKEKFELVETKTLWLSSTPSIVSKLVDSSQYRVLTVATLKDKATGKIFAHCNTHMDYEEKARPLQYNILFKLLDKIEHPLLLTGDFNTPFGSEYYNKVQSAGYLNSSTLTNIKSSGGTYVESNEVIDFCFVSPKDINVISYRVVKDKPNGVQPSDHNPIVINFSIF